MTKLEDGQIRLLIEWIMAKPLHMPEDEVFVEAGSIIEIKVAHKHFRYATFNIVRITGTFIAKQSDLLKSKMLVEQ